MSQKYSNRGEFDLINDMVKRWSNSGVLGDIGDDAALLPFGDDAYQAVTTDMLIQGRHFKPEWSSWADIGYKAIAVNFSDIAAMGGQCDHVFISLGLTEELTSSDHFDHLISGMDEICQKYNCRIDGGDTTRSEMDAIISVTALGRVEKDHTKKRNAAVPGDIVAVTGTLGDAAAALALLSDQTTNSSSNSTKLFEKLHRPEPRIPEGLQFGKKPEVHAMMDLSDGLAGDIRHIMNRSGCGAQIHLDQLPLSDELRYTAELNSWDPENIAARGGDDYELMFTVDADTWENFRNWASRELAVPVTAIGTITEDENELSFLRNHRKVSGDLQSYDHFKSK